MSYLTWAKDGKFLGRSIDSSIVLFATKMLMASLVNSVWKSFEYFT